MNDRLIWASILVLLVGAAVLNSSLPRSSTVIASYESGKTVDSMRFNYHEFDNSDGTANETYFRAIFDHEVIHSLKGQGIVDQDVPTAAAIGYYREWHSVGSLREKDKQERFDLGAASSSTGSDIMEIITRYRSRDTDTETVESYSDGAMLAGLISSLLGNDDQSVLKYIIAVSMGLDHDSAMATLENENLSLCSLVFGRGDISLLMK